MGGSQRTVEALSAEDQLEGVVLGVIAAALGRPSSDLDAGLSLDDLGVDSHALAEIALELEDQLGFEFSADEVDRLAESATVRELVASVWATQQARAAQ